MLKAADRDLINHNQILKAADRYLINNNQILKAIYRDLINDDQMPTLVCSPTTARALPNSLCAFSLVLNVSVMINMIIHDVVQT